MILPHVTDHAVLRYLERVKRVDIAAIREHIAVLCAPAASVKCSSLIAEGFSFELQRNTVLTVRPYAKGQPGETKRRQFSEGK